MRADRANARRKGKEPIPPTLVEPEQIATEGWTVWVDDAPPATMVIEIKRGTGPPFRTTAARQRYFNIASIQWRPAIDPP